MAGLLGDIYSTIDSTKRKLSDFVQNPVESTRQFIFNRNEDAGKQLGLLDQSFRGANGQLTIGPQTPQAQAAHNQLTDGLLSAMMGATVWHGSPHKFNKFDSSKIGTGEGAQAYGHGLYLAESPQVATQYRDALSDADAFVQGKPFNNADPIHRAAAAIKEAKDNGNPIESVIARLKRSAEGLKSRGHGWATELADEQMGTVRALESGKVPSFDEVSKGQLYKVDLPDDQIARMLDWDKPLSQQPQSVQAAFGSVDPNGRINTGLAYERWRAQQGVDPVAASEKLKALGIPGVKYLDGGSRGRSGGELVDVFQSSKGWQAKIRKDGSQVSGQIGDIIPQASQITTSMPFKSEQEARQWAQQQIGAGTSNYVVFPGNEGLLKILERNGQGLLD